MRVNFVVALLIATGLSVTTIGLDPCRNAEEPDHPEGAASAQNPLPPVPTTKILAISHFMGTPMTPAQRSEL